MMTYKTLNAIVFCLSVSVCADFARGQGNNARIDGLVLAEDNKPISGVYVTATQAKAGGARITGRPTAKDGGFSLQNLPAGSYRVCAQAPGSELLDPCRWASPVTVPLTAGQALTGLQIKLIKGTTLRVHIDDPAQHLATHEGKTPGAHLLVGVWSNDGLFHAAPITSKGNQGRDHGLVVPFGAPLKVSVASQLFQISDDRGTALAKGGTSVQVQATPGLAPAPLKFTVTGVGPR